MYKLKSFIIDNSKEAVQRRNQIAVDRYFKSTPTKMNTVTEHETNNECRTSGTDVSNLGDHSTMTVKTADGKEIGLHLYGR